MFCPLFQGIQLGFDGLHVLHHLLFLAGIAEEKGGVIYGAHDKGALFKPLPVLTGNAEIGLDEAHGGHAAKAHDDLGANESHLFP